MNRDNNEVLDRRRQWSFSLKEADGSWAWHMSSPSGSVTSSPCHFTTLDECIADATKHGYVIYEDRERRRPDFPGWDD